MVRQFPEMHVDLITNCNVQNYKQKKTNNYSTPTPLFKHQQSSENKRNYSEEK